MAAAMRSGIYESQWMGRDRSWVRVLLVYKIFNMKDIYYLGEEITMMFSIVGRK